MQEDVPIHPYPTTPLTSSLYYHTHTLCLSQIIMLEDGVLHPGLPLLVWCMVAQSKGYALPTVLLALAVGVITEVPIH